MNLLDNPFNILNVSPRDNRDIIVSSAELKSLTEDENICIKSRSELINPRRRLRAEIGWLPGLAPTRVSVLISDLNLDASRLLLESTIPPLAYANLLAAGILKLSGNLTPEELVEWILKLSYIHEDIRPEQVHSLLNEERVVSNFPEISNITSVEEELTERRKSYRKIVKSALNQLQSNDLIDALTSAIEAGTENGQVHGPILLDDLVEAYEVEVQSVLSDDGEKISLLCDEMRSYNFEEVEDDYLDQKITKLEFMVRNWDRIAQPIQVSTKSRGLEHHESLKVGGMIRGLAIDLFNDHGKLNHAKRITAIIQEVFAEVVDLADLSSGDAEALEEIEESRKKQFEEILDNAEKWGREITWQADVGRIFKTTLSISPQGISWGNEKWEFENITRVRWGGTRQSINGIPAGTEYTITFGNDTTVSSVKTKKDTIYNNFVDRLWKTVGVGLLTKMLHDLEAGELISFTDVSVKDAGVVLIKRNFFAKDEPRFFRWSELVVVGIPGAFRIKAKAEDKFFAILSYEDDDNTHILEAGIRALFKTGDTKMSSLLH